MIDITNLVQDGPNWGRTGLGWAWDRASAEGLGCDINITCELKKTWSLSHTYTASNLRNWVFHSRPETYCDQEKRAPVIIITIIFAFGSLTFFSRLALSGKEAPKRSSERVPQDDIKSNKLGRFRHSMFKYRMVIGHPRYVNSFSLRYVE